MALVYVGACSHAPGITGRADQAEPGVRDALYAAYDRMRLRLEAAKPDALMVIAAEHFANFFMDNMPSYAIGMADSYHGPIEDPDWLGIRRVAVPGHRDLSLRLIERVMADHDVSFAEEWRFDHGISVPLHFLTPRYDLPVIPANINCQGPPLTPLRRAWNFGRAVRRAADALPERIAVIGTGGISHWPATPDSGRVNEAWDREFLDRWRRADRDGLCSYSDAEVYSEAGQGGFEIRTLVAAAAAAAGEGGIGAEGTVHFYAPIPIFAVGCTIADFDLAHAGDGSDDSGRTSTSPDLHRPTQPAELTPTDTTDTTHADRHNPRRPTQPAELTPTDTTDTAHADRHDTEGARCN